MVKRIPAIILIVASVAAISLSIYFYNTGSSGTTTTTTSSAPVQRKKCPEILDMDPQTPLYNVTGIDCVQALLERCQPETVILGYQFGSTKLSIKGEEEGRCSIRAVHEIEMGENTFSCSVPFTVLAKWESWKNPGGRYSAQDA